MDRHPITVVLVEDEPLIRLVTAEILIDFGYEVVEAEDAAEAVEILERQATDINVVFTDVHMPGTMDGIELAHRVRSMWPWIKVLVASGRAQPTSAELPEGSLFLDKPYTVQQVIDRIAALSS